MPDFEVWLPHRDGSVVEVVTGQAFELDRAEWDDLARARSQIVHLGHLMDEAATLIDEEVARRLDLSNDRHILVGDIELEVNAPRTTLWDVPKLLNALSSLVAEGRLGAGVPPRCVAVRVEHRPVARELAKLLDHDDPRVRELIDECRQVISQKRRVRVKGKGSQHVIN